MGMHHHYSLIVWEIIIFRQLKEKHWQLCRYTIQSLSREPTRVSTILWADPQKSPNLRDPQKSSWRMPSKADKMKNTETNFMFFKALSLDSYQHHQQTADLSAFQQYLDHLAVSLLIKRVLYKKMRVTSFLEFYTHHHHWQPDHIVKSRSLLAFPVIVDRRRLLIGDLICIPNTTFNNKRDSVVWQQRHTQYTWCSGVWIAEQTFLQLQCNCM